MRDLGRQEFAEWPVWSEYYEPDELEDLVAWGVEIRSFYDQLRAYDLSDERVAYPVLKLDPLPDRMRIYVRANFQARSGHALDGYVVTEDAYCVGLFVATEKVLFNVRLRDLADADIEKVARYLEVSRDNLFPLTYMTEFRSSDGTPIAGTFDFL
jgi:hypothetical protein